MITRPKLRVWVITALCFSVLPAAAQIPYSEERDIALWILRLGGQVMIDGIDSPISDPFELPARDFRIVMVDMHGTITEPKDLERLKKLTEVRELYIPARVWSPVSDVKAPLADESFAYYQGMKNLVTFHAGLTTLAWLDIGDKGVENLAPLAQLKSLRLDNTTIKDPKCFDALVNLEYLDLGDAYVLDNSLAPLANMKHLLRLTLTGTLVTDDGLKYLRDLTDLEELDLYGVKVTDTGVEYLSKLSKLRSLNMLGAQVTDASADTLARFAELRELNLYRSKISDAGLTKLRQLRNLETLDLRYSGVSVSGVQAFRAALPKCQVIYVATAPPVLVSRAAAAPAGRGDQAVARWVESLGGRVRMAGGKIESISLARAAFTDAQVKFLAPLAGLQKLNLEATDVSDLGLESLAGITSLRELNLSFTAMSDRGMAHLERLTGLRRLALAGVRATGPGFEHVE